MFIQNKIEDTEIVPLPEGHKDLGFIDCIDPFPHRLSLAPNGQIALLNHGSYRLAELEKILSGETINCLLFVKAMSNKKITHNNININTASSLLNEFKIYKEEKAILRKVEKSYEGEPFLYKTFNDRFAGFVRLLIYEDMRKVICLHKGDELHVSVTIRSDAEPRFGYLNNVSKGIQLFINLTVSPTWLKLRNRHITVLDNYFIVGNDKDGLSLGFKQIGYKYEFNAVKGLIEYDWSNKKYKFTEISILPAGEIKYMYNH